MRPVQTSQEISRPWSASGWPLRIFRASATCQEATRFTMGPSTPMVSQVSSSACEEFPGSRSEEHTSELQSQSNLVCRLLLEKKKTIRISDGLHPLLRHHSADGRPFDDKAEVTAPPRLVILTMRYFHSIVGTEPARVLQFLTN